MATGFDEQETDSDTDGNMMDTVTLHESVNITNTGHPCTTRMLDESNFQRLNSEHCYTNSDMIPEDCLTAQYSSNSLREVPVVSTTDLTRILDTEKSVFRELNINTRSYGNDHLEEGPKPIVIYNDKDNRRTFNRKPIGSLCTVEKNEQEKHILCCSSARLLEKENLFNAAKAYKLALKYKPDFELAKERLKFVHGQILQKKRSELYEIVLTERREEETPNYEYNEQIKSIRNSNSSDKIFETVLNKAVEHSICSNQEAGQVIYEMLFDLKPNFAEELVVQVHCDQQVCVWKDENTLMLEKITKLQLLYGDTPLVKPHSAFTYLPFQPTLNRAIAAKYADDCLQRATSLSIKQRSNISGPKIKVGYISSDFKNHSMSHLISGIFQLHNKNAFEVYLYSLTKCDDSVFRQRIEEGADHFLDIYEMDFKEIQERIVKDGINILINLNGYTQGEMNELFALKLVKVQVLWLGFPGTSGSNYMDYIITDPVSTPLEFETDFSEKFAYLPPTHFIGDHLKMFQHLVEKIVIKSYTCDDSNSLIISGQNLEPFRNACRNAGLTIEGDKENGESVIIPFLYILTCKFSNHNFCVMTERLLPRFIVDLLLKKTVYALLRSSNKLVIFGVEILNGVKVGRQEEQSKWSTGEIVPDSYIYTAKCQYGLPDNKVIYVNFNQNYKFDKVALDMWIKILKNVPNSVIWLLRFHEESETNIRRYIRQSGEAITDDRIVFSDPVKKEEYIRRAQLADVFLDTPLCNAHTTGMDAIFAGLPLVTLPQRNIASRIAASLIKELGCEELIAKDEEDYVDIAVKLGNDCRLLKNMKSKVFTRRLESSLFDLPKKVESLEELFKCMHSRRNQKPQHITQLVSKSVKEVPANILQQDTVIVQSVVEHVSLQRSEIQEHSKNLTQLVNTELPIITEEHESDEEVENGNIPLLDDIEQL
ncbi:UDP-N-acetylglucosamine--peptide N-acetylglucosaminyltransferase 110 kDa subunit-like [Mercenaria mercenaria]|uniref:UDP-N-acetylglucosamine--peptide N-acetylglucosaminyltransferase 110 kDa subunit-like n=1 Tax=Mercenaria mercenaria TaxID=6596 RepID=UPI00234EC675|nr:UDP-N-acetylglucosamine--peptide N-acetylglucosaminyltransferase 110 kDa subunit-like [Mercenaria mercenaria]XP_053377278.1 UDP-N-acetylglucosamine--peptide N-acetylglucosaminyltransferase 110 kDa subunit-like [Mercenaria mercenaria]XP_053377279.1 UDP-N-acetylglucosamine--peptide N-acetylglucosaminyltransferase 110 kDa subunit-like [Mercenaria mercenaria]